MVPDCLLGVVPQPTDSRLSETNALHAGAVNSKEIRIIETHAKTYCKSSFFLRKPRYLHKIHSVYYIYMQLMIEPTKQLL